MSSLQARLARWSWDRFFLVALSFIAVCVWYFSTQLIQPYPHNANWFESTALFPKLSLLIVAVAGLIEIYQRRHKMAAGESEELDSSAANIQDAISMVVAFALYMLAVPFLGYLISTLLFLSVGCWLLQFDFRTSMLLAITLSVTMWVVFVKVLKVYFGHAWLI
ncbi:MAG: tripartite tricarboxylate transporter TctB family protein [Limnohabitans sp.]